MRVEWWIKFFGVNPILMNMTECAEPNVDKLDGTPTFGGERK